MSTPANLTFTDITTRCMNSLRMPVANTVELAKVGAVVNEVYRDIAAAQDWWWLTRKVPYNLTGPYYPGAPDVTFTPTSASLTKLSQTITFDAVPGIELSNAAFISPGSGAPPFINRFQTFTSTQQSGSLDSIYLGVTSTAVTSFFICFDVITPTIFDMNKAMRVTRYGYPYDLKRIGMEEMDHYKQFDLRRGPPEMWSVFGTPNNTVYTSGTIGNQPYPKQLIVHPYPDKFYRVDIWYKQSLNTELSGTDLPLIPDDYRQVLVYGTLARAYPIFLNDGERGSYYKGLFDEIMMLMAAQQRDYAKDQSGVQPRMTDYRRKNRRPRTAYTMGNWFDIFPSRP